MYYSRFEESTTDLKIIYFEISGKYKIFSNLITTQTERKIRDRDQVAVFGGRKEKVCRRLKTIDEISRQKIDIRVGMVPVL